MSFLSQEEEEKEEEDDGRRTKNLDDINSRPFGYTNGRQTMQKCKYPVKSV